MERISLLVLSVGVAGSALACSPDEDPVGGGGAGTATGGGGTAGSGG